MVKRLFALVGITVIVALGLAVPAHAAPDDVIVSANKTSPYPIGQKVKFSVRGCDKKEEVTWQLLTFPGGVVVQTQISNSNGSGKDDWTFNIPGPVGSYEVRATCLSGGVLDSDSYFFDVVPPRYPPGRPGPDLPEAPGVWVPGVGGTFAKSGCDPFAEVTFRLYPYGSSTPVGDPIVVTANASGTATVFIPAPENSDQYYVLAECSASSGIPPANSVASGGGSSGAVPSTGSDIQGLLRTGLVLFGVGTGIVLVARRRRRPAVT